jgi:hypothetical protein
MQRKTITSLMALILATGTCTQIAHAQDSNDKSSSPATETTDNKTRSETDNQSFSTKNDQQDSNDANIAGKNINKSFDSMDKSHRGYLMPADVVASKTLSTHFQSCDTNHDGRLSREEFNNCKSGM